MGGVARCSERLLREEEERRQREEEQRRAEAEAERLRLEEEEHERQRQLKLAEEERLRQEERDRLAREAAEKVWPASATRREEARGGEPNACGWWGADDRCDWRWRHCD